MNCINSSFVSYVGNYVSLFEKKLTQYTRSKYAVATSSGTSALHLILKYLKIGKNDEVLMPTSTYVATAAAVIYCNSTPNFVDNQVFKITVNDIASDQFSGWSVG